MKGCTLMKIFHFLVVPCCWSPYPDLGRALVSANCICSGFDSTQPFNSDPKPRTVYLTNRRRISDSLFSYPLSDLRLSLLSLFSYVYLQVQSQRSPSENQLEFVVRRLEIESRHRLPARLHHSLIIDVCCSTFFGCPNTNERYYQRQDPSHRCSSAESRSHGRLRA